MRLWVAMAWSDLYAKDREEARGSIHEASARKVEAFAGDEPAQRRYEVKHSMRRLDAAPETADRNLAAQTVALILCHGGGLRLEQGGGDPVDRHALVGSFGGKNPDE